ncbi:MAG: hypothetical protein MJ252_13005 [archaeon]|nr:hypothetical protein [archaeon]
MGNLQCCAKGPTDENVNTIAATEPEVKVKEYSSSSDKSLNDVEGKLNLFNPLSLATYVNELNDYSLDTATLNKPLEIKTSFTSEDSVMKDPFTSDDLQIFLDNRIKTNKVISDVCAEDEKLFSGFKDLIGGYYEALGSRMKKKTEFGVGDKLNKKHLLTLGFLYCQSSNVGRIRLLFDLFKKEEKIYYDKPFQEFLFALFTSASYSPVYSLNKIQGNLPNYIKPVDTKEIKRMVNLTQTKDTENLMKIAKEKIWGNEEALNYTDFKTKLSGEADWILNPRGIRHVMEQHDQ